MEVLAKIEGLFDGVGQTCLYIGANQMRCELASGLKRAGYHMTLVEVFPDNANHYVGQGDLFDKVICDDIRLAIEYLEQFDLVIWWHGPEHVRKAEHPHLFQELMELTKRLFVIGCPEGVSPQEEVYGNKYEEHLSYIYREELGFFSDVFIKNRRITAWNIRSMNKVT